MSFKASFVFALVATTVAVSNSYDIGRNRNDDGIRVHPRHMDDRHGHNRDRDRDIVRKFECPAIYGRYPHPQSCKHYFECRNSYATLMHCRGNSLYDESRRICRERKEVHCHRNGKDDNKIPEDKEEKEFKCPYVRGSFAHPKDCSKYYICVYNLPTLHHCPSSELYHERHRRCIHRSRVDCGKRIDGEKNEKEDKTECPYPYNRRPFAHPKDCSKYIKCVRNVPSTYTCPDKTLFDESFTRCIPSWKVTCGKRINPYENEKEDKTECPYPYNGRPFAHPKDCSKYIKCIHNVPSTYTCPDKRLFDESFTRCIPSWKVTCGKRINPYDLATTPVQTSTQEITTTSKETTTHEITTKPEEISTEIPTATNAKTTTEEHGTSSEEIGTEKPTIPEENLTEILSTTTKEITTKESSQTPEKIKTENPSTISQETTINELSTTSVEIVTEGTTKTPTDTSVTELPTTMTSPDINSRPETTLTSRETDKPTTNSLPTTVCDKDDVNCIDGIGDVIVLDCPQRFGYFPHGSNKQLFIHCDNWKPFIKSCGDGTEFSPTQLVCVWKN